MESSVALMERADSVVLESRRLVGELMGSVGRIEATCASLGRVCDELATLCRVASATPAHLTPPARSAPPAHLTPPPHPAPPENVAPPAHGAPPDAETWMAAAAAAHDGALAAVARSRVRLDASLARMRVTASLVTQSRALLARSRPPPLPPPEIDGSLIPRVKRNRL